MNHVRGIAVTVGIVMIVVLGFLAVSATAERNNLRDDLARALERESACILRLANNHIPDR